MSIEKERDALAAELAAIRAAGGEQVDVVAEVVSKYGDPEAFGERELVRCKPLCNVPYKTELMTVAQHQRIVAAMAAEVERKDREAGEALDFLVKQRDALRAELEAARKQEPVAWRYRHSEQEHWHVGDSPKSWWECQPLYALPPLAGQVSKLEAWTVMCGDWRDTTLAIHGEKSGHIASGIPEGAAHAIVKAHNAVVGADEALLATPSMEVKP